MADRRHWEVAARSDRVLGTIEHKLRELTTTDNGGLV
jgi:hypothetical protein